MALQVEHHQTSRFGEWLVVLDDGQLLFRQARCVCWLHLRQRPQQRQDKMTSRVTAMGVFIGSFRSIVRIRVL